MVVPYAETTYLNHSVGEGLGKNGPGGDNIWGVAEVLLDLPADYRVHRGERLFGLSLLAIVWNVWCLWRLRHTMVLLTRKVR